MKISFKALGIGYLVSFTGGILHSVINILLLTTGVLDPLFGSGLEAQAVVSYVLFGFSLLFNLLAGYICAKVAKREEVFHGIILGILIWFISLLSTYVIYNLFNNEQRVLGIQTLLSLLWPVMSCLLGAVIRKRINDKQKEDNELPLEQKIENLGNNN